MKNKLMIVVFAVLFVLGFIFFYITMDVELYRYFEGGIFSDETEINEQVEIVIGGEMQNRILEGNIVYGTFRIMEGKYYDFQMTMVDDYYQGTIYWKDDNDKYIESGEIAAPKDLYSVWAHLDEMDEKYGVDTFIVGPAKDMEEANQVIRNIFGE